VNIIARRCHFPEILLAGRKESTKSSINTVEHNFLGAPHRKNNLTELNVEFLHTCNTKNKAAGKLTPPVNIRVCVLTKQLMQEK
jgi:hypothetical protein